MFRYPGKSKEAKYQSTCIIQKKETLWQWDKQAQKRKHYKYPRDFCSDSRKKMRSKLRWLPRFASMVYFNPLNSPGNQQIEKGQPGNPLCLLFVYFLSPDSVLTNIAVVLKYPVGLLDGVAKRHIQIGNLRVLSWPQSVQWMIQMNVETLKWFVISLHFNQKRMPSLCV